MNNRILASLTNQQISPLYYDNRHEKRRVTRELEYFTLSIRLAINNIISVHYTNTAKKTLNVPIVLDNK